MRKSIVEKGAGKNKYLYNGIELNTDFGLDWSDYGARYYDAAIGRWGQVDPLAEERNWLSPYNYVQNNPLLRIDPTGALDDEYRLNDDGTTELLKETDDDFDILYTSDAKYNTETDRVEGGTIIGDVNKGFLKDGMNLKDDTNEILVSNKEDFHSYLNLISNISTHVDKEIGGALTKSSFNKLGISSIILTPYKNNTNKSSPSLNDFINNAEGYSSNGKEAVHLKDGKRRTLVAFFHTHPGTQDGKGGYATPSRGDKTFARKSGLTHVVFGGRGGVGFINSKGKVEYVWE